MNNSKLETMNFYKNKRVFITGHTGFKGTWLCNLLVEAGAEVYGFALEPPTNPSVFELSKTESKINSTFGDVRNFEKLKSSFDAANPEIVFHLAAQPIVRESYLNPAYTYETNVMGTVNILECIRLSNSVRSFLNVTTDKVYKNNEWHWGYRENDILDGFDPYSNSKSCSELVTNSYKNSFFQNRNVSISTARAGNVIGGGDFAKDRIIPDCIRAAEKKECIIVRNPYSTRPFQHVIEPLFAYLLIAKSQYDNKEKESAYNVGPDEVDCIKTGDLVNLFCDKWQEGVQWKNVSESNSPHEAGFLKLDTSKIKTDLGWCPTWNIENAVEKTVEFSKAYLNHENVSNIMLKQIKEFLEK